MPYNNNNNRYKAFVIIAPCIGDNRSTVNIVGVSRPYRPNIICILLPTVV